MMPLSCSEGMAVLPEGCRQGRQCNKPAGHATPHQVQSCPVRPGNPLLALLKLQNDVQVLPLARRSTVSQVGVGGERFSGAIASCSILDLMQSVVRRFSSYLRSR